MKCRGKCIWLQLHLLYKADSALSWIKLAYQDRQRAISSAKKKAEQHPTRGPCLAFFFWNDHKPLADPSAPCSTIRANQKKTAQSMGKCSSKIYKVSCGFWMQQLHFIPCSLHFALKVEKPRVWDVCVCMCSGKENAGWVSHGMVPHNPPKILWGSNVSDNCLISLTLLLVLLVSRRSLLVEMQSRISRMVRYRFCSCFYEQPRRQISLSSWE